MFDRGVLLFDLDKLPDDLSTEQNCGWLTGTLFWLSETRNMMHLVV